MAKNDKIVPVVIKLQTESDNSLDTAVSQARAKLNTLRGNISGDISAAIDNTTQKGIDSVRRTIRDETIKRTSEIAVAGASSAFKAVEFERAELSKGVVKLQSQIESAFKANVSVNLGDSLKVATKNAIDLEAKYVEINKRLATQEQLAKELATTPAADFVKARAQLQSAQLLTKGLQEEAGYIKRAYQEAFDEVNKKIVDAARLKERTNKEEAAKIKDSQKGTATPAGPAVINSQQAELQLIRIKGELSIAQNREEQRRVDILKKQADLQIQIARAKKEEDSKALTSKFADLNQLDLRSVEARKAAINSLALQEKAVSDQIEAIKAGKSAQEVFKLRTIAEQSKITSKSLVQDAQKIEQEYKIAFNKLSAESVKAGKDIRENITQAKAKSTGSSTDSGSAFNFLAPLTNQFSGLVDSVLGSLGSKLGLFRTTVGAQIGLSIGRGVGDGLKQGVSDLANTNVLAKFFESLDQPSKQLISNLGTGIVVASAAAAAALGGLIAVTTQVAGKFEALEAQLVTSFKDPTLAANRFKEAVELAAHTPFDVEQVVRAEVSLAARGEKSLAVLKDVTELAAAQNRDLNETAVAVGHATEGSLRGYESLRNSFGVTTSRLKDFGAVVDSQNRILVHNEYQINRNKEALLQLIRTDFGGGVERLSKTLVGLQSNLRDETEKVSAQFGSVFLPTMKQAIEAATFFIQKINSIPPELKFVIAGSIAAAAGIATLVVGLGTASLAVNGLLAATEGLLAIPAVAAMEGFAGSLTLVGGAAGIAARGVAILTGLIPEFVLIAAAAVALSSALATYEEQQIKTGNTTLEFSKAIAEAKRSTESLGDQLKKTFNLPPEFKLDVKDSAKAIEQIDNILKGRGALGATQDLTASGIKGEDLKKDIERRTKQYEFLKKQLEELNDVFVKLKANENSLKDTNVFINEAGESVIEENNTVEQILKNRELAADIVNRFPVLAGKLDPAKLTEGFNLLSHEVLSVTEAMAKLDLANEAAKKLKEPISETELAYGKLEKAITQAESFNKFALQTKDVDVLNKGLEHEAELYGSIKDSLAALIPGAKVTSVTLAELTAKNSDAANALIQAYFKSKEALLAYHTALNKIPKEEAKERIEAIELVSKHRLLSLQTSERDERIQVLKQQSEQVKGSYEAWEAVHQGYIQLQEQIKTTRDAGLRDELLDREKALKAQLDLLKPAAQEEIRIAQETQKEVRAARQATISHTKDAVNDLLNSTKQQASGEKDISAKPKSFFVNGEEIVSIGKIKSALTDSGVEALNADEKLKIYQASLKKLGQVTSRPDIQKLRSESIELDKVLREAERTLNEGITKAEIQKPIERFKDLQAAIKGSVDQSDGLRQKLNNLLVAERVIQDARSNGQINNKDAEKELLDLEKQRHEVQGQITRAIEGQRVELSKMRDKELSDDLKILELKKQTPGADNGAIDSAITNRKRQLIQSEFQTLAQEQEKELELGKKTGLNRELTIEKFHRKESELIRAAYLEYAKAEEDKYKAVEDRLKKEQSEIDKYKEKRLGGKNSPLISLEELGFQSTLPGFGSDQYSDKSQPFDNSLAFNYAGARGKGGPGQLLTFDQFKLKYEGDNRLKRDSGNSPALPSPSADIKTAPTQVTNTSVYINGSSTNDKDIIEQAVALTKHAINKTKSLNSTFAGPTEGSLSTPTTEYPKIKAEQGKAYY